MAERGYLAGTEREPVLLTVNSEMPFFGAKLTVTATWRLGALIANLRHSEEFRSAPELSIPFLRIIGHPVNVGLSSGPWQAQRIAL